MVDHGETHVLSMLVSLPSNALSSLWTTALTWQVNRLVCGLLLLLTCLSLYLFYRKDTQSRFDKGKPPLLPYRVPFLGHLLVFVRDPAALCLFASLVIPRARNEGWQLISPKELYWRWHPLPSGFVFARDVPHIRSIQHQFTLEELGCFHAKSSPVDGNAKHSQIRLEWSQIL